MGNGPHTVVVGAGITGAFAAYFLALSQNRVTLVDPFDGANASNRNVGGLNPLHGIPGPLRDLAMASLRMHLQHGDSLHRLSGIDFGGRFTDRLHIAIGAAELGDLAVREELHNAEAGFSAELLSTGRAGAIAPGLSPDVAGALLTTRNARVEPDRYTRAVTEAAVRLGAERVRGHVTDLLVRAGRVTGVRVGERELPCDAVVIASGPWCTAPSGWLGIDLPVTPVKGELLLVELGRARPTIEITWDRFGIYPCSPRWAWLGGTEETTGLACEPTTQARNRILEAVADTVPGIGPLRVVEHVAGVRPVTPGGLPLVGLVEPHDNVCVALGGGRKGMLLAPAMALAAADLITRGTTDMPIPPLSLGRAGVDA